MGFAFSSILMPFTERDRSPQNDENFSSICHRTLVAKYIALKNENEVENNALVDTQNCCCIHFFYEWDRKYCILISTYYVVCFLLILYMEATGSRCYLI
jgi:hypothetical protein